MTCRKLWDGVSGRLHHGTIIVLTVHALRKDRIAEVQLTRRAFENALQHVRRQS